MFQRKNIIYISCALLLAIVGYFFTPYRVFILMLIFVGLLITEALPVVISSLFVLCLIPIMGITQDMSKVFWGFSNSVVFFMIASFGIAAAFMKVPLPKRILRQMLRICGDSTEKVLLAMMVSECLISSVMSNVPSCLIFMTIGKQFLDLYEDSEDRSKTGKSIMLGVTYAGMIGGMLTPAGSSINILALNLLTKLTGETVTFGQWVCVALPLVVFMIPMAWILLVKMYKPVEIDDRMKNSFLQKLNVPDKYSTQEIKVIAVMSGMIILWILSSWISWINVVIVALCGCVLLQMPGIEVIDHSEFMQSIKWEAIFLVATVMSIGNIMAESFEKSQLLKSLPVSVNLTWAVMGIAVAVFIGLIVLPIAPSLVTIMVPTIVAVTAGIGMSPAVLVLVCALCAGNCYLLPLDTVCMMTYSSGYYSAGKMFKVSVWLQLWLVLLTTLLVPTLARIAGLI